MGGRSLLQPKIDGNLNPLSFLDDFFLNLCPQPVQCCAPEFVDLEEALYTEADESDLEKLCYHSDCDESFFTDLASSLNVIGNPLIGCATGFEVLSLSFNFPISSF